MEPTRAPNRSDCNWETRTAEGKDVLLSVTAATTETVDIAKTAFKTIREDHNTRLKDDGDIEGIGDEAYRKSVDGDDGMSESLIAVRSGNSLITVFLSVESESKISRPTLAPKVLTIAAKILGAIPKS
jgi:hypothetical protein